jgi:hypothetical protein
MFEGNPIFTPEHLGHNEAKGLTVQGVERMSHPDQPWTNRISCC